MQQENRAVNIILSSREVVARDLPHPTPLSLLNRKQQPCFTGEVEDPGQKISGMTSLFNNGNDKSGSPRSARPARTGAPLRSGFTLIELLVVVLIIGILAAVALPQYKDTVDKARLANLVVLAKAANKASESYYMANGSYPTDWTLLDLDFPGNLHPTNTKILNSKYSSIFYLYDGIILVRSSKFPGLELVLFGDHNTNEGAWTGYHGCYAVRDNPHAIKLCMHLSGRTNKAWVNNNSGEESFAFKIN